MSSAQTTTNHDTIRTWCEQRDGTPATVRQTGSAQNPGVLRIDFPGGAGEDRLEHISWEAWFKAFEDNKLAFLYQDKKADGETSTFFKLVNRDSSD